MKGNRIIKTSQQPKKQLKMKKKKKTKGKANFKRHIKSMIGQFRSYISKCKVQPRKN